MSVSSRAGRSIVLGTLCLALIGGTLGALSAVTNRNGAGSAGPEGHEPGANRLILWSSSRVALLQGTLPRWRTFMRACTRP